MSSQHGSRLPKILAATVAVLVLYLGWNVMGPKPDTEPAADRGSGSSVTIKDVGGGPENTLQKKWDSFFGKAKPGSTDLKDQAGNALIKAKDAAENAGENAGKLYRRAKSDTSRLAGEAKEGSGPVLFSLSTMWHAKEIIARLRQDPDWVPYKEIPPQTRQALVAIEDHGFYEHGPFDVKGMFRAALVNATAGQVMQGGSTLTQQMVKNVFLSDEQTMARKFQEAALSMYVEHYYTKNEILELYFNTTYFGNGYYGLREACRGYLGKEPSQLNLPESAMIAALPNAPSALNPYKNPMGCGKRTTLVLREMKQYRYIGTIDMENAIEQGVTLKNGQRLVLQ